MNSWAIPPSFRLDDELRTSLLPTSAPPPDMILFAEAMHALTMAAGSVYLKTNTRQKDIAPIM